MKIETYVSQWFGQVLNFVTRFLQICARSNRPQTGEHSPCHEDIQNSNIDEHIDEHEYVMNYR